MLSRHRDESICIGDDIIVTVVEIRGDKVRLGVTAPKNTPVHRQEVYEAILKQRGKVESLADKPVTAEELQEMIDTKSDPQE